MPDLIRPPGAPDRSVESAAFVDTKEAEELAQKFEEVFAQLQAQLKGRDIVLEMPSLDPRSIRKRQWEEKHVRAFLTKIMLLFREKKYEELTLEKLLPLVYGPGHFLVGYETVYLRPIIPASFRQLTSEGKRLPKAACLPERAQSIFKDAHPLLVFRVGNVTLSWQQLLDCVEASIKSKKTIEQLMEHVFDASTKATTYTGGREYRTLHHFETFLRRYLKKEICDQLGVR